MTKTTPTGHYREWRSFEEARAFVQTLNLRSRQEWHTWAVSNARPEDIPLTPANVYRNEGWVSLADWLGPHQRKWRSFEEARQFVRALNLAGTTEWKAWCASPDRPQDIPNTPEVVYQDEGWVNLGDWLGSGHLRGRGLQWRSFEEARAFVRALNLGSGEDWKAWAASTARPRDIPSQPAKVYRTEGWSDMGDWLGTGKVARKDYGRYRAFEDAREFVRSLNLSSLAAWKAWAQKPSRPRDIPICPEHVYKNQGWAGVGDWLGTRRPSPQHRTYLAFVEARAFVRALNLANGDAWKVWSKSTSRPLTIPTLPSTTYKGQGWVSMGDWLGTQSIATRNRTFRPFEEAREYVRALNLRGVRQWNAWARSPSRPLDIPSLPRNIYRDQGWVNLGDWLGTGDIGPRERKYRPFVEAREFVRSLNLGSVAEWQAWSRSPNRPADIPGSPRVYRDEWVNWFDWLGHEINHWDAAAVRRYVASLIDQVDMNSLDPNELFWMCEQNGLQRALGAGKGFARALESGRFALDDLKKFARGEQSLAGDFLDKKELDEEGLDEGEALTNDDVVNIVCPGGPTPRTADDESVDRVVDPDTLTSDEPKLPVVSTRDALVTLDFLVASADAEMAESFCNSASDKVWNHAFRNEAEAVEQAEHMRGTEYVERTRERFLSEFQQTEDLPLPGGWAFRIKGQAVQPNRMQRLNAVRLLNHKRIGNWSGGGSGKTLAAALASRVAKARMNVICCPNAVVDGWKRELLAAFPDSIVRTKDFNPDWPTDTSLGLSEDTRYRYLVLNYEAFQQPDSANELAGLLAREHIDFIVIDELHLAKQRSEKEMSQRRKLVEALVVGAGERNADLRVLGTSATPVINNLQEGKSLVELIDGRKHDDLDTRLTLGNCMAMNRALRGRGMRWMPDYPPLTVVTVPVDCGEYLPRLIEHARSGGSVLELEQILSEARRQTILDSVTPGSLIYTDNVTGIVHPLARALRAVRTAERPNGWSVGFCTGEDNSGLMPFKRGELDVLIGSSAVGTGVDGLQDVCNNVIYDVLPWTAAAYDQNNWRALRQGQTRPVTIVLPLTFAEVDGKHWSWCESKMKRLLFKRSVADAAVDGVVPEGHLISQERAHREGMAWLARLDAGDVRTIERPLLTMPLLPDEFPDTDSRSRVARWGGFNQANNRMKQAHSTATHTRLQADPTELLHYHTMYREARKTWDVVPFESLIAWLKERPGLVVGDLGCGEALVAAALKDTHTVHSFDHVALSDDVVACDISQVPLADKTLDVAILSLALMGSNFNDYVREAHRTLKVGGWLHLVEPAKRIKDQDAFLLALRGMGFEKVEADTEFLFTFVSGLKSARPPINGVELEFNP